ncbi:hypothetical protein MNBD_ALPHA06-283 [hydrothermal vent metagenome]|uniref:Cytochrome c, class I n=1 Tax=hydrothermal vent metagenome TaxID=652676 RepID=A0A3B0S1R1_9ZZZZ
MQNTNKYLAWLGATLVATTLGLAIAPSTQAQSAKAKKTDPMLVVRGAKAWKENCGRCHNLRSPKEMTDEEWDVSVAHMRVRANLTRKDAEAVRAFLKASN